jgi:hypothetical protein
MRDLAPGVVYVMGSGRSGTTLLGSILGELPGVTNAGELSWVWERGIIEPRGCGCGRDPRECPVWSLVLNRTAHGADLRTLARSMKSGRQHLRLRNTWRLLAGGARLDSQDEVHRGSPIARYAQIMDELYGHLADVSGAHTIVDTSKYPADAAMLGRLGEVRPFFVHLVRDSRAVANSWRRRKEGIAQRKVVLASMDWLITNAACDAIRRRHPERSMLLRYEDLLRDPATWISAVAARAGLSVEGMPFIDKWTVDLGTNHTVSGNPDRFHTGPTRLQADEAWRHEMPAHLRTLVTLLTWPSILRYGYSLDGSISTAIEPADALTTERGESAAG